MIVGLVRAEVKYHIPFGVRYKGRGGKEWTGEGYRKLITGSGGHGL